MRHGIRAISGKARLRLFFQQSFFAAFQPRYCLLRASAEAISMQNVAACFFCGIIHFSGIVLCHTGTCYSGCSKTRGRLTAGFKTRTPFHL
ncbi:hypothetical protein QBS64_10080 [Cronobacter sakazakii]|nr:hypothetical protein [Cronobacter sakazakii]